jgi:hypothetical protein
MATCFTGGLAADGAGMPSDYERRGEAKREREIKSKECPSV